MILAYLLGAWLNGRKVNEEGGSHQRKPGTIIINDISTVYSIASLYPDSLKKEIIV
jgi:hypothetical protein